MLSLEASASLNRQHMTTKLSYTVSEVIALTGIKRKTLQRWRLYGGGPRWIRPTKRLIRYPAAALEKWIDSQPGGGGDAAEAG
jgi:predicted DNA-binding transcriptional regulator AlpA